MFVMLPVMLMARKLDGEDPTTIHWARVAYGVVQTICVLIVSLTYLKACQIKDNTVVFVPPPAMVRARSVCNDARRAEEK